MPIWQQIVETIQQEFSDLGDAASITRVTSRLVVAALLGGCLGFERERMGKSAGLRTHMLVALGSALFVLAPLESGVGGNSVSRVIQGLVAGIGFLGAGAIVKGRPHEGIQGLTTAASIWMTAALGMTVALGREFTAIFAAAAALAILHLLPTPDDRTPPAKASDDATARLPSEGGLP